jgi:hypothetical protein
MSDVQANDEGLLDSTSMSFDKNKDYFDHIRKVNDIFYDQIKISDQKAAYIFTFMLAFLVSSSEGRGVFTLTRYASGNIPAIVMSALLACASVFTIICAISVVLPRKGAKTSSLFWGAWPKHRPEFLQAARHNDPDYLFNEYVSNVDTLSEIARGKYRFAGLAFRGLVVTVLAYVFLLVAV